MFMSTVASNNPPKTPFEVRRRACMGFRQVQVLAMYRNRISQTGQPPSYSEIVAALEIDGKGNVSRIVQTLIDRGELKRDGRKIGLP